MERSTRMAVWLRGQAAYDAPWVTEHEYAEAEFGDISGVHNFISAFRFFATAPVVEWVATRDIQRWRPFFGGEAKRDG